MSDTLENPAIEPNPITPAPVEKPVIEKPVIEAPKPAADEVAADTVEAAAKAPLPIPEAADKTSIVGRDPIHTGKPLADEVAAEEASISNAPEHKTPTAENPAQVTRPPQSHGLMPGVLLKAQENVTASLKLSADLTKQDEKTKEQGVIIKLVPKIDHTSHDNTNLTIEVSGRAIRDGNIADVHREIMANLNHHPVLGSIFATHKSHEKEVHGHTVLHLDMNHIPIEQYVKLVQDLANTPAITAPATTHADEAAEAPKPKQPHQPQPDAAADTSVEAAQEDAAKKPHKDEAADTNVDAAKKEHTEEVAAETEASAPVAQIKAPVDNVKKLQPDQLERSA